ncbi:MAG: glycosyltransferase family 10 domain-containing protein [Planctomycetaceae bacterium]
MTHDSRLQVHLKSPWSGRIETELAVFSPDIPLEKADALFCEWVPAPELFTFPRRKAWYCCEPACQFNALGNGTWPTLKKRLGPHEFLWHGHPDPLYRVPHITHCQPLTMNLNPHRKQRAVAIVSNHGGNPLKAHPDIRYRNRLITHPSVDLYGRSGWKRYRQHWYSWPGPPKNYCGELAGDWDDARKRQLMSEYKVCVCLENMSEPGYFTEKFVEAVQAGCVPVYRASEDISQRQLKGAIWFDPLDVRWLQAAALTEALSANIELIREVNRNWMQNSDILRQTSADRVFSAIATALS